MQPQQPSEPQPRLNMAPRPASLAMNARPLVLAVNSWSEHFSPLLPLAASKKRDDLSRHESDHDLKHEPIHDANHDAKHDSKSKPEDKANPSAKPKQGRTPPK